MWIIGNYIPIVATRDSYYQQLISGYGQEYADSIMSYISAYTLPLLLIAGFVCGEIGFHVQDVFFLLLCVVAFAIPIVTMITGR